MRSTGVYATRAIVPCPVLAKVALTGLRSTGPVT